jgi:hypothetical protein
MCTKSIVFELSLEVLKFGKNMIESKLKGFLIGRIEFKITLEEPPSEFKVSKLKLKVLFVEKRTQHWYKDMI